ncbi:MAG: tRNA lysidine(34) synthetase TilS [Oscillospiraceae bacterium]|nr:tRNA lysidine(34) synthetase TilS [Oscillospiraceae bacterium]
MTLHRILLESGLLPAGGILTAAFSGGADSTALLLGLHALAGQCGYSLRAVHVHHGIRGAEADRDAAFCEALCAHLGIPYQCVHVDALAYAKARKLSLETAARLLRYEALREAAPAGLIATAHHAEDNAETVLFHLIRGSGMRGLRGIPKQNGRIIRPLLGASKAEILAYLAERGQPFVEDSTNFTDESTRSRLRRNLLPLLEAENSAYLAHISRTAALLTEDDACLTAIAAEMLGSGAETGRIPVSAETAKPIRMRMYLLRLDRLRTDASYDMLEAIDRIALGGGRQMLAKDVYAETARGILYLYRQAEPLSGTHPMQLGENRIFRGKVCRAELTGTAAQPALSQNHHKSDMQYSLDFDKIIGTPFFRRQQREDRMQLPGRAHSSRLRTLVQAAVPAPERKALHMLFDAEGVIWCEGIGIAARVQPDGETRRRLTLTVSAEHCGTNEDEEPFGIGAPVPQEKE